MANKSIKARLTASFSGTEMTMAILAILSVVALLIPKDLITRKLVFIPQDHKTDLVDDRFTGGKSVAKWIDKKTLKWQCQLSNHRPDPYCNLVVSTLKDNWNGLDLRSYKKMTVYGKYEGPSNSVRLYLRNRHPSYYVYGDDNSTKYNVIFLAAKGLETGLTVQMKDFSVADWWLLSRKIPRQYSQPDFNDVAYIELQSPMDAISGKHVFQLDKIVWSGDYLSNGELYRFIIISWSLAFFLLLFFRVIRIKTEIDHTQGYETINKLLNLQNKQFEDLARTDQLTGLLNRIGIRDGISEANNAWSRRREPFSFILVDIDNFKNINDTFGHVIGDKVLVGAASIFSNQVRKTDYLARWSGDEFMLLCPNTDLSHAQTIAENLRLKLEISEPYEGVKITASFGVSTMTTGDLNHVFEMADQALSEAKGKGRNSVVAYA